MDTRGDWSPSGEIGALPLRNLLLEQGAIKITQSVAREDSDGKVSQGQPALRSISSTGRAPGQYVRQWRPNQLGLLFAKKNGTPWDTDVVRKRKLYPPLEKLGIPRCGFHAFRHGNETVMDQESVPMAVRQTHLGHSDARTTMLYSHVVSEDGRRFAARLGDLLTKYFAISI